MGRYAGVPDETVVARIHLIRNRKVMIDSDLAELYGVETGYLNRQVKRNRARFPEDFMFRLTREEFLSLRCQIGILKRGRHSKYLPLAFTEQGVAMLSSVLHSKRAVKVNIQIMRVFTRIREMIMSHKDILLKLERLERKLMSEESRTNKNSKDIEVIFAYLKKLLSPPDPPRRKIGF